MPFKNCYQCRGDAPSVVVVKKFDSRECGHVICRKCRITHDEDVDDISTTNLSADEIAAIDDEAEYRRLFVETSSIRNERNEDYGNFKWNDQAELRSGVAGHVVRSIRNYCPAKRSLTILDVGCGSGFTSVELANEFPESHIFSIDPSPQVMAVDGYEGRVSATQTTLQGADFGERKFDVVAIIGNLMLHDDPLNTIDHALNVLKKDGLLIIDFKNIRSTIRQLCILLARLGLSGMLPAKLFNRNFLNMRFGYHDAFIIDYLKQKDAQFLARVSKPPRLLEFDNKSEYTAGLKGKVWKLLDRVDRLRKQQAWIQLEFVKK